MTKTLRLLIEQLRKIYVRKFCVNSVDNSHTAKDDHLFIVLQKRNNICDLAMGEEYFALGVEYFYFRVPVINDIYVIDPVYWVPNDTANTLSQDISNCSLY